MKPRPQFMPISADIDDAKLEQLARDKGVGAMVKAKPVNEAGEGRRLEPKVAAPVEENAQTASAPRGRMKTVTLELPDYVWRELKIRAAHRETSVRHVIMTSLKAEGFEIKDDDMVEDGRRLRGASSPQASA